MSQKQKEKTLLPVIPLAAPWDPDIQIIRSGHAPSGNLGLDSRRKRSGMIFQVLCEILLCKEVVDALQ